MKKFRGASKASSDDRRRARSHQKRQAQSPKKQPASQSSFAEPLSSHSRPRHQTWLHRLQFRLDRRNAASRSDRRSTHNPAQPPEGTRSTVVNLRPPTQPTPRELRAQRSDRRSRSRRSPLNPPENPINLPRPRSRSGRAVLYGVRLLILGIGLGVIAGTVLSVWDPATRFASGANLAEQKATDTKPEASESEAAENQLKLQQELTPLKTQIQAVMAQNSQLTPGVMVVDLDNYNYVDINASQAFPAASTIKFPILVALFQDIDAGKVRFDEMLTMRKDLVAPEAGDMQYQPVGTKFSLLETITEMMTISDNTATNMIIDRLGGAEVLNRRFQSWGLAQTGVHNWLPDVQGTNTTSPKDLATLFNLIHEGKLVSWKSRDRIFEIMHQNHAGSLLPKGLGEGSLIAHKTGTIGIMLGDAGLIDTPTGKRYVAVVLVKRPRDDDRAETLIQKISKLSYQAVNQEPATPVSPAPKEDADATQNSVLQRSRIAQP